MRKYLLSGMCFVSLALSACSLAPEFQRPQMAMPGGWSNVSGVGLKSEQSTLAFWQELGSEELNRVIEAALAQNLDLEAALHRIEQAKHSPNLRTMQKIDRALKRARPRQRQLAQGR